MEKIIAIILAAGKGKRMGSAEGSDIPKVMFEIADKPMIEYSIKNIQDAGINNIVLVVGYKKEMIINHLGSNIDYAVQEEQLGTGHAVAMAKNQVANKSKWVLICYGDMPFYQPGTIKELIEKVEQEQPTMGMLTVRFEDPEFWAYGRIVRDSDNLIIRNIEQRDCSPDELKIKDCNPSFYIFDNIWLWQNILKLGTQNTQKEYYLTDLIALAAKESGVVGIQVENEWEAFGINNQEQLKEAETILAESKN